MDTLRITNDWYKADKEKEILSLREQYMLESKEMRKEISFLQNRLNGKLNLTFYRFSR